MKSHRNYSLIASIFLALALLFAGQSLAGDIDVKLPDKDNTSSFQVKDSDDNVLMKVQSGGNVGIGTTSPETDLEIYKDLNDLATLRFTNPNTGIGAGSIIRFYEAGLEQAFIGASNSENTTFLSGPNSLYIQNRHGPLWIDTAVGEYPLVLLPYGGNVGIGIREPSRKLDVVGNQIRLRESDSASAKEIMLRTDGAEVDLDANNANLFIKSNTGNTIIQPFGNRVGIGTTSPTHILHVDGVARSAQATWATSSDGRVKYDVKPLSGSLIKLQELRPVTFQYIEQYRADNKGLDGSRVGFIAQEVKEVIPEMVTLTEEVVGDTVIKDFQLLNMGDLIPMLVGAIKEQQKIIEEIRSKHERELKELRAEMNEIKSAIGIKADNTKQVVRRQLHPTG